MLPTVELLAAHRAALAVFDRAVHRIAGDWAAPTPCEDWTVRDLLNHLVAEQLWVPHLLRGETLAQVGTRYDGDMLGEKPVAAWESAAPAARAAWTEPSATTRRVHVSYGTVDAPEYGWQMTMDLAVHGWDLASALGVPAEIPEDLATQLYVEFEDQVQRWSGTGLFARPVAVGAHATPADRLVALFGRDPGWRPPA